jgi:heme/copper-type cytochrome/quinol oxidase subunit 2
MPKFKTKTKMRGLTTVEALLIAAAFIIVGVIGLLTFQGMGKSAAESLRANAIVTADRAGFDVTVEVLNGKLSGVLLAYGESDQGRVNLQSPGTCIVSRNQRVDTNVQSDNINPPLVAGQSATCRFNVNQQLQPGTQYTYVVYVVDASSGKTVQIAKGVVTVGIS